MYLSDELADVFVHTGSIWWRARLRILWSVSRSTLLDGVGSIDTPRVVSQAG